MLKNKYRKNVSDEAIKGGNDVWRDNRKEDEIKDLKTSFVRRQEHGIKRRHELEESAVDGENR